jgi:CheY-like chemotaxis protein
MSHNDDSSEGAPPVLIVDDDPGNLLALEAVFESLNCRVVRSRSGAGPRGGPVR